ncbi:hypothetical protein [Salsuginibacillus kocurii]|uniref:hypothetical protein n=1 Tax=Salsuginibacillus kocurii TaxID=427078 RepID=UPI00035D6AB8|nr:hypothetical protein [Salsuginibacillus kocurii]
MATPLGHQAIPKPMKRFLVNVAESQKGKEGLVARLMLGAEGRSEVLKHIDFEHLKRVHQSLRRKQHDQNL